MKNLRIIFMGTPDFATHILKTIIENQLQVVAVITAPDKPAGRGQKIQESSVKQYAKSQNLPILQPTNLKNEEFLAELSSYKADIQIVVAFRMLPKAVWNMPEKGTFNLHASLLPDYRGAAPINWAIINQEEKTGVSTFFIDEKIDTGAIILQESTPISPCETAGSLHDKLMLQGAELVMKTIALIAKGQVKTTLQNKANTNKEAPKIFKENSQINWEKPLKDIDAFIRGLSPFPTSWCFLKHKNIDIIVKIHEAKPIEAEHSSKIGSIKIKQKELFIACKGGFLKIEKLQMPSKKQMTTQELLNGFHFENSDYFF